MTRLFIVVLALAAGSAVVATQNPPDQANVFRAAGDTVPVYATVTEKSGRLVTGLGKEQFTLRDNGRPQPITIFDNSPQPIRLIVLIDVSGSMYGNLPLIRAAAEELFKTLAPGDLATVGTLGRTIDINPSFTRDPSELLGRLPERIQSDAPTPLWRGMNQAMDVFADLPGRRVILVVSDGKDSPIAAFGQKYVGFFDIVDRVHADNVMMYAVAMRSRMMPGTGMGTGGDLARMMSDSMPSPAFGKAADETGGGYVEIRPRDDLREAFQRVGEELHSQYLLGFAPSASDGKKHEIEIRVSARDMKVRARKGYVAPKSSR